MTTISRRSDSHIAIADFPDAVGPQMTGMVASEPASASAETAFELIPGKLDDRGPTMHIVRRQLAVAQRDEQRAHLLRRERVTCFDRGLARNGGRETLMSRGARSLPITRERRQRLAQTTLGVESRVRRGHGVHDHRLPAEFAELIAQQVERVTVRVERLRFGR